MVQGISFASKAEAALYQVLKLRESQGEIEDIKCQVQVYLTEAKILYKPDFSYTKNGKTIWAEFKGFETAVWRIKRRLWKHYGPGPLEVYKGSSKNVFLFETIPGG